MSEHLPSPENEEPPHRLPRRGWGWGQWLLIGLLAFVVCAVGEAVWDFEMGTVRRPEALSNCRQIIIALKAYAADHGGSYPEGVTANDAFRLLFKAGLVKDEQLFSAPGSSYYVGDNTIGEPPEYVQALEAGENHWAMTKALGLKADGNTPLVFENPALASWPPKWDSKSVRTSQRGRIWGDWRIVVGRNDGSVSAERLIRDDAPTTTLRPIKGGKNLFDLAGPHEIMNVAP